MPEKSKLQTPYSQSSHSLQTNHNNNRDPTPSCCQRMAGQTPWLSSSRPGDLAPAYLSVISCPPCPDAWVQLSSERAVTFFFSTYLPGPSFCLDGSYSLLPLTVSPPPPIIFQGFSSGETSPRKLSLITSYPIPSPTHFPTFGLPQHPQSTLYLAILML